MMTKDIEMTDFVECSNRVDVSAEGASKADYTANMPVPTAGVEQAAASSKATSQQGPARSQIKLKNCPECNTAPGQLHTPFCHNEICPFCGNGIDGCNCEGIEPYYMDEAVFADGERIPWTGELPYVAECRAFGWYIRMFGEQQERCAAGDRFARPDTERVLQEATWDWLKRQWVLPRSKANAGLGSNNR